MACSRGEDPDLQVDLDRYALFSKTLRSKLRADSGGGRGGNAGVPRCCLTVSAFNAPDRSPCVSRLETEGTIAARLKISPSSPRCSMGSRSKFDSPSN